MGTFKYIGKYIAFFIYLVLLANLKNKIGDEWFRVLSNLGVFLILVNLFADYLKMVNFLFDKNVMKKFERIKKARGNTKKKLYHWSSRTDLFEDDFSSWLDVNQKEETWENLSLLRNRIKETYKQDIYNMHLMREYIEYYAKNNFLSNVFDSLKTWFVGVVFLGIIGKIILSNLEKVIPNVLDKKDMEFDFVMYSEYLTHFGFLIFSILLMISHIRNHALRDRKTLDVIKITLDSIIKEYEDKA